MMTYEHAEKLMDYIQANPNIDEEIKDLLYELIITVRNNRFAINELTQVHNIMTEKMENAGKALQGRYY